MRYVGVAIILFFLSCSEASPEPGHEGFQQCMLDLSAETTQTLEIIYTSSSPSYSHFLLSSEQNPRWVNSEVLRPLFIVTPFRESQVRAAILCSKARGLQIRVRSGGHDYEGLSYLCRNPFVLIDLFNLRSVEVNIGDETAWVQSGATLGELYYGIAMKSKVHGFPAGICPSVGLGGHFSGGGFGTLLRKHGLAADNIIDARLVDANGRILDRASMGEDLFWAIRGGGAASFGVVLSWKIKLVQVPPTVTVFSIYKSREQGAIEIVNKWQYIADKLPEDLFVRAIVQKLGAQAPVKAIFNSLFLGKADSLMPLMNQGFPELGLKATDCKEMSWIGSILYFTGYQNKEPLEVLLDRNTRYRSYFKGKSDHVQEPIPEGGLRGIWERFTEGELVFMIMDPYGGRMSEIPESELSFAHRKGSLYNIQYLVKWEENGVRASNRHINWIRMLYTYVTPYVSKNPRTAYLNYKDLDPGMDDHGNATYSMACVWGEKYFKGNFRRLSIVKGMADPENFFRNEQSVPLYSASTEKKI